VLNRPQGRPGERVADDRGGDECAGASDVELDGQLEQRFVAVVAVDRELTCRDYQHGGVREASTADDIAVVVPLPTPRAPHRC
jgi:hypothetical protein